MKKIFIIEGYSLDSIKYYLEQMDSEDPIKKWDAYRRLCKVTYIDYHSVENKEGWEKVKSYTRSIIDSFEE